ncbi:lantibiotic dehydratase [Actinomadura napierensis]|uniref:Lantibiotic dehydratase n=1 Tax=Actinomadura napierensis TaxID=267854 RepID=A0ABP5M988_9ACTN
MASRTPAYRWQPGALLRATTAPEAIAELPRDLQLFGEDAPTQGRDWLADVWREQSFRDALEAASPALVGRIQDVLSGKCREQRRVRRVVLSVASYLLRWQRRPTPFGLFAGVAPVAIGDGAGVSLGTEHLTTARADADWLADIITRLHQCSDLLRRLPVVANDAGQVRGDRFVIPGAPGDGRTDQLAPIETSVRHTRPLAAALEAARRPTRFSDLCDHLTACFPASGVARIEAMLTGLVSQNVLISSLWAPMTRLDALAHLCDELRAVSAETIADIADMVKRLYEIQAELDRQTPAEPWRSRTQLLGEMRRLSDAAPVPLVIDTGLDCQVQIPEQVAVTAQDAMSVLYRLTPHPFGYKHWRDYHGRFREHYGAGAVVPVNDLVADSGLGLPAEYLGSSYSPASRLLTDRDEKLLNLVQEALLDGRDEIVLSEPLIEELSVGDDDEIIPVPRAELALEIHARSVDAIARGWFRLVVTGTPRPGSSMAGRFAHLMPEPHRNQLEASYRSADAGAISAQQSFAPRRRRNDNVARTSRLLPHVITLSEHRADRYKAIGLDDLAVTADARQFFLLQLSTGRRVEPRVVHALEAGVHTPPLARFLAEITTARCGVYKAFDFGAASRLPYLPRVRYKRTVLAPARWLLTCADLPGRNVGMPEWESGLRAWQSRFRVGDRVAMVDGGQRLPLDLAHPVHRAVLRTRLDGARRLELRETASTDDLAWIGRAHELLLPFSLVEPAATEPLPARAASIVITEPAHMPGRSTILHARVHAHPLRYDEILITCLPELLQAIAPCPQWWFRRHRRLADPASDQYLALYVRLPDAAMYGQVAEAFRDWAQCLQRRRLISGMTLATYQPQTGRFGDGAAMDAAQAVFCADSAAALAQIEIADQSEARPAALAAASMVDLTVAFAASPEEGIEWLIRHLPREHDPIDRDLRDQAIDLTTHSNDPCGKTAARTQLPARPCLAAAWQQRRTALATYRAALEVQRDPLTVLRSLLHQHHMRAVGVDPDLERLTGHLARSIALRHLALARSTQ